MTRAWWLSLLAFASLRPRSRIRRVRAARIRPARPRNREARPYAGTPAGHAPVLANSPSPITRTTRKTRGIQRRGARRPRREAARRRRGADRLSRARSRTIPTRSLGTPMLNGAQLAIEEANAAGGYGGKPFRLMVHNDQAVWGASSNEIVKMAYDDKVWAMLGSISADSTHIALRVSLKAEVPIVNSAATDPTIPETIIPWYLTTIQDDRVQSYTLARRIYTDLGLKKVALLRVNDRYGRFGVLKFKDAARRLGHPVLIEQKYMPGDDGLHARAAHHRGIRRRRDRDLGRRRAGRTDREADARSRDEAARLRQFPRARRRAACAMPARGGRSGSGVSRSIPRATTRSGSLSTRASKSAFSTRPEVFASLAYDTMNILLQSICRAGLNRGRIRDALAGVESYKGVTGEMAFDPNSKNIVPLYLATVHGGKYDFRRYPHSGPVRQRRRERRRSTTARRWRTRPPGPVKIAVFGPDAEAVAAPSERHRAAGILGRWACARMSRGAKRPRNW